jgi:hypothetical protein
MGIDCCAVRVLIEQPFPDVSSPAMRQRYACPSDQQIDLALVIDTILQQALEAHHADVYEAPSDNKDEIPY